MGSGAYQRAGRFTTPYGMDECEINKGDTNENEAYSFAQKIDISRKRVKTATKKRTHKRKNDQ